MNKKLIFTLYTLHFTLFLSGCATTQTFTPTPISRPQMPGIYHKVEKGQTLWRIAMLYGITVDDLVKVNRIPNKAQIGAGQLLFIPGASSNLPVSGVVRPFQRSDFVWPAKGRLVSFFGSRKDGTTSKGIEICLKEGADIVASRPGRVVFCDSKMKGLGKVVIIDHLDGFSTLYAYNSAVLVKVSDEVKQGEVIAKAGASGRAKGACLHFQIRKGDRPQNPFYYLPR